MWANNISATSGSFLNPRAYRLVTNLEIKGGCFKWIAKKRKIKNSGGICNTFTFLYLKKEKNPHASFHLGYNVSLSELQEQCIEGHYESIAIGTIKHTLSM